MELTEADRRALLDLSHRYASAVDRRDFDGVVELFTPAAELITLGGTRRGHRAIAEALEGLRRYGATFHLLGQIRHWIDAEQVVRGEAYCVAHHFTDTGSGTDDRVLYIRYEDRYEKAAGGWRFARRHLDVVRSVHEHQQAPAGTATATAAFDTPSGEPD